MKGQGKDMKGQGKDIRQKYSGLFVLFRPKSKKTPFLTDYQERTRKGQERTRKGQNGLKKENKGPKKDKWFIFADLFQKGQKGQEKTKNIKGAP